MMSLLLLMEGDCHITTKVVLRNDTISIFLKKRSICLSDPLFGGEACRPQAGYLPRETMSFGQLCIPANGVGFSTQQYLFGSFSR
ncbi:MAG: hypothetical protein IIB45_04870 [Candidatus Marinimicrobia bacterium]|nr:hypothetical protein [Candidatus Neomarinimicrobiota bacterium]